MPARARATDPVTSKKVAEKITPSDSQAAVLKALRRGPATAYKIAERIGDSVSPERVRGAISELRTLGYVAICGIGKSPRGNECHVYGRKELVIAKGVP